MFELWDELVAQRGAGDKIQAKSSNATVDGNKVVSVAWNWIDSLPSRLLKLLLGFVSTTVGKSLVFVFC